MAKLTNRYLERIRYGNRTPATPDATPESDPNEALGHAMDDALDVIVTDLKMLRLVRETMPRSLT